MNTASFVLTIFGASGDLAKKKLFPSLYALAANGYLPKQYVVFGYARTPMSDNEFRESIANSIATYYKDGPVKKSIVNELLEHCFYVSGQYDQADSFSSFKKTYQKHTSKTIKHHLFYFSTPPSVFQPIVEQISLTKIVPKEQIRLVLEKPFGHDQQSAQMLYHFVSQHFQEEQIFLLDHYLGKDSVQSILNLRFNNRLLSNVLVGSEIANIQISALESVGVEERAGYFEGVGIVRDMIQSHLLQVLSLAAMTIPNTLTAESLHREKYNVLSSITCPCDPHNIVLAQYKGYKKQDGVKQTSKTETFAAVRLLLDRRDWHGVPIYIRTGKKLHEKHTYVVIELEKFAYQKSEEEPNRIIIEFYPEPRMSITLSNSVDGNNASQQITTADKLSCSAQGCLPDHATLLLDALQDKQLHFLSFQEIIAAWRIVDQMTDIMEHHTVKLESYAGGSMGPKGQHALLKQDGFSWYDLHQ